MLLAPTLAVFAAVCFSPAVFNDGDTNWHVATGLWILQHHAVPTVDPFSYTAAGLSWTSHEWLSEVLLALAYSAADWSGVAILTAFAAAMVTGLLANELSRRLGALSVLASLGVSFSVLVAMLLARPHILASPLLALWTIGLMRARESGRAPSFWLLGVMLLWANLHGGYAMGLLVGAVFALEAIVEANQQRLRTMFHWGVFLGAAALTALATPHGVEGWLFPLKILAMKSLPAIGEWTSWDFTNLGPLEIGLLLTLFVCLHRGVRVPALRLGLLLLLLHMTLHQQRHSALLSVLAPLLLAQPLAWALDPQRAAAAPTQGTQGWERVALCAVASVAMVVVGAVRLSHPVVRVDSRTVPVSAFASVPPSLANQPMFNDYAFGGWLIFKGVRPFIDGRADMYGDAFITQFLAINRGDVAAFDRAMKARRFRWTIVSSDSPLIAVLDAKPGWRRIHTDPYAVVHAYSAIEPMKAAPLSSRPRSPQGNISKHHVPAPARTLQ